MRRFETSDSSDGHKRVVWLNPENIGAVYEVTRFRSEERILRVIVGGSDFVLEDTRDNRSALGID